MKNLLVVGGAGYVGSHCCKAFAEAGWNVTVYDNLSTGWRDMVRWGRLIEADILNRDALAAAFAEVRPDAVAHFAALSTVGESVTDPRLYYRVNVAGSLGLLEAMLDAGVDALVFSSTCATYGMPVGPLDEAHPQAPINPYGWTKLAVERMLADFGAAYGLRSATLRYFNAAGADPDGEIGERHVPETHVIPLAIQAARTGGAGVFTVNGDDFETRDGTAVRDYVHVADLADAHRRAVDHLAGGGASVALNLGTGIGTTVKEIADAVDHAAGTALRREIGPRRPGDPPALVAAAEKARRILGWEARRSAIDEIVASAWRWHAKDHNMLAGKPSLTAELD